MTGCVVERTPNEIMLTDDCHRVTACIVNLDPGVAITFAVCGGAVPANVRRGVVSAVFDLPELRRGVAVHATVPLGDAELLAALRDRCSELRTRPAGASCLIDAHVRA